MSKYEYRDLSRHEMEQQAIGALVLLPQRIVMVVSLVTIDDFVDARHQIIFGALQDMQKDCEIKGIENVAGEITLVTLKSTLVTLKNRLETTGGLEAAGGVEYLADLVAGVVNADCANCYAKAVRAFTDVELKGGMSRAVDHDGEQ